MSYFRHHEFAKFREAKTYIELRDIALTVLGRMPPRVSMVCGPITTGGAGSREANLKRFESAIEMLHRRGENIFSQMPFEDPMQRIQMLQPPRPTGTKLLSEFYLPLFTSGKIIRLCFLPDWKTSFGASWEHDRAVELGLERKYFTHDFEKRDREGHPSLFTEY